MKYLIPLSTLFIGLSAQAVQTTARPFSFEFYAPTNELNFDVTLEQWCRYEIPVWSDSAEYKTKHQSTPLREKRTKLGNGLTRFTYSLNSTKSLEQTGFFKSGKECTSGVRIIVESAKYALGWAGQYSRPIEFKFLDEMYAFKEYDTTFDAQSDKNIRLFSDNEISFEYKTSSGGNQVNVTILSNGKRMRSSFPQGVLKNPKTNMPYKLK
ncbi:hypothetical protein DAY19_00385 [Halobacteriovorax vibrionivorans]|uniref:Uncharacterized protein n=1 Tax=Halobacteriovorax vibrionivorans TaxID=2152716 RepID=A0ABY0IH28_9BACT|nr:MULTISPECIES: hypothetical protein [Halobacteriovorax]RZF22256.1 hypothetical protein DAY19_00385 [Halobacteriovorax vibrionivorans]TGD48508.1 hypothetical protein EP118_03300 [Halobacteriovorax sp. Y22]